ncbi:MAG: ubiquinol-cytochrome c reductase iron-sulfur subunit [Candidatus Acidiferrales bacterium]
MSEGTNPAEPETPENTREAKPQVNLPSRRTFIAWALGVPGAIIACLMCVPLVRESLYPVFAKGSGSSRWSDLGPADQYASLTTPVRKLIKLQTVDGWRQVESENVVYVTKGLNGKLEVLTAVCPHLGCEVAWQASADHFHCPCHGSVFAPDGTRISGPSPRGMDTLPVAVKAERLMVRYEYFENLISTKMVVS